MVLSWQVSRTTVSGQRRSENLRVSVCGNPAFVALDRVKALASMVAQRDLPEVK